MSEAKYKVGDKVIILSAENDIVEGIVTDRMSFLDAGNIVYGIRSGEEHYTEYEYGVYPTIDALCDSLRKQYEELTKGGKE
jgi:hypothetical protein